MAEEGENKDIQKTPEELAAEKKIAVEQKIQEYKDNKEISEDEKSVFIAALEEEIKPIVSNEPSTESSPTTPVLSFEDEQMLNTMKRIAADPHKANYLLALDEGNIEDILLTFVPKGEDYSKLSDKAVYQRSLELQGYEGDDLEKQMGLFKDFSDTAKSREIKKAKAFLDENGRGNIPVELTKKVEQIANDKKRRELASKQYNEETIQQIESKVSTLEGKSFNGYVIKKEDKNQLTALIALVADGTAKARGKYDVEKSIDVATKAYTFDKVIKAKNDELAAVNEKLSKANIILRKLANVSVGTPTNKTANGASAPTQKTKQIRALDGSMITVNDYSK
jgi:hypothetical protein